MPSLRVTSVVFSVCRFWLRFGEAIDCQPIICGGQGEGGGSAWWHRPAAWMGLR